MNDVLLQALSRITREEQDLLDGTPLHMDSYGNLGQMESEKLLPPRQVITIRPHTRFTAFPMHTHDYVEMTWQVQGHTMHRMEDGTRIDLQAGELLLFGCNSGHAIEVATEEDIALNFIVLPEFFDVALEMVGSNNVLGRFLIDTLRQQMPTVGYFHFRVADAVPIQLVLESMAMGLIQPEFSSRRVDQTTMGLLFLHLLRHTQTLARQSKNAAHMLVMDALGEIEENYQKADFSALANRRHVSLAYLSRKVKEATGYSCTQLLQKRRMEKAMELLTRTDLTIIEISERVGYSNTSYFYRIFKQIWGKGPMNYRKEL